EILSTLMRRLVYSECCMLPQNGSMILYNRKKVKYRKDGYCWKKRKDGKTTREDHMKLKVQGVECHQTDWKYNDFQCFPELVSTFQKSFDGLSALVTLTYESKDVFVCVCPLHMTFLRCEPPFVALAVARRSASLCG
ncbi:hypothetical protein QQF64_003030, partial [Cirrhinus molitorella]